MPPLVKSHLPLCSVNRAKELRLKLTEVATCGEQEGNKSLGCPVRGSCRFERKAYGGFRKNTDDDRPHMVGYYLRAFEGGAKKDWCACFNFVQGIQPRMDFGNQMREQGNTNFEVIRIIAQEGEPIDVLKTVPTKQKDNTMKWVRTVEHTTVPEFPDPAAIEPNLEFERDIIEEMEGEHMAQAVMPLAVGKPVAEPKR